MLGKSTRKQKGSPVPPSSKRQKLDEDTPDGTASPPPRKTADIMQSLDLGPMPKPFKNPDYSAPRAVKKLKQIMALEKALDRPVDFPTYWNIEAPPSFTPAKKYCDITGLEIQSPVSVITIAMSTSLYEHCSRNTSRCRVESAAEAAERQKQEEAERDVEVNAAATTNRAKQEDGSCQ
ncbi:hypothetical protein PhCBS80983_g05498 [Powellomyces hirtus]|uniref:Vps72/YL1 C-terminal domain-containing protein n=1 Tax=Powellomyces hirtus TaxID=109895 RepID=A0A507DTY9_9FUNG|nr:hypothetical protein PhCBS80983_g05498 [Powellomyces hirtus]